MKTNHDGTITLNAENTWTVCGACGQRVTGDSIHTCSPQTKQFTEKELQDNQDNFARAIEERHGIK